MGMFQAHAKRIAGSAAAILMGFTAIPDAAMGQNDVIISLKAGTATRAEDRCEDLDFGTRVSFCLERPASKQAPCRVKLFNYDKNQQKVLNSETEIGDEGVASLGGYRLELVNQKTSMLGKRQHCVVKVTR